MTAGHTSEQPTRRRWFRFSLRTLFVAVTVLCVWLGWNANTVQKRKTLLREIKYCARSADRSIGEDELGYAGLETTEASPKWQPFFKSGDYEHVRVSAIRRLLGDESCLSLHLPQSLDRNAIERAEKAFPEAVLVMKLHESANSYAFRDSLYAPASVRKKNVGDVFQTGLK